MAARAPTQVGGPPGRRPLAAPRAAHGPTGHAPTHYTFPPRGFPSTVHVNTMATDHTLQLARACAAGRVQSAERLLTMASKAERVAALQHRQPDGAPISYAAAASGHAQVLLLLAQHDCSGASLAAARNDGGTPFLAACRNGHVAAAQFLWEQLDEAGRAATLRGGSTAIELAATGGCAELVRWLLEPHRQLPGSNGLESLLLCACKGSGPGTTQIAQLVASQSGADPSPLAFRQPGGATPFMVCCSWGNLPLARWLSAHPAVDTTVRLHDGSDALYLAATSGHIALVELLVELDYATFTDRRLPPTPAGQTAFEMVERRYAYGRAIDVANRFQRNRLFAYLVRVVQLGTASLGLWCASLLPQPSLCLD